MSAPPIFVLALTPMLVVGCSAGDDGGVGQQDGTTDLQTTDTGTPGDSDTDTDTDPGPDGDVRLEVSCLPTANALRFACTVEVEPAQPVVLTFARTDGLSATRTVASDLIATEHVLPLYFMAPQQVYDVTVTAVGLPEELATTSVTTGSVPALLATSLAMTGTSTLGMIGSHHPCNTTATAVVYDTNTGDLLWYETMDPGGTFGSLDMVSFTEDLTVLGESEGDIVEVDLTGEDVVRLEGLDTDFGVTADGLFGNFHHDITKRNGVYYVFYQESYGGAGFNEDILDTVILFDGTGTELARWYPIDHLVLPPSWNGDFLHTNAVFVDAAGDIYLSWLTQETVAKIAGDWLSPDFGTPIWMLNGADAGALSTLTTDWSGVGAPSSFGGQHNATIRPDGRLQLLDNNDGRGLVISVDEVAGTATVDAAYATNEAFCGPQGTSVSSLAGNALVGCTGDWIREYDGVSGVLLWEAEVQCSGGGGGPGSSRWYPLDGW